MANESSERCWWEIRVTGYGSFVVYGTEAEAEEKRAAKADWEGGVGRKARLDPTNRAHRDMVDAEIEQRLDFRKKGYPDYDEDLPPLLEPAKQ